MDELDFATQPQCPECGVVMRTEPHAFVCPHCGHLQLLDDVEMPWSSPGRASTAGRTRIVLGCGAYTRGMRRTLVLLLMVGLLTGCAAPAPAPTTPAATPTQTLPAPVTSPTTNPTPAQSDVDVETMKQLWAGASEKERADVLAEVGLTTIPDEVTDDMVEEAVRRAGEHGIDVTHDDMRQFLDWATTP